MYSVSLPSPVIRNGARFYNLLTLPNTRDMASATVDYDYKLTYPGAKFCVQAVTDSYKFSPELQFGSFSLSLPEQKRRGVYDSQYSHYARTESGFLPLNHQTAIMLRSVADQVDALCNYSELTVDYSNRPRREVKSLLDVLL